MFNRTHGLYETNCGKVKGNKTLKDDRGRFDSPAKSTYYARTG